VVRQARHNDAVTRTTDVPALNVRVMGVAIAIEPEDHATRDRLSHQ